MKQELQHRGVRYIIGEETLGSRPWVIYPEDGPAEGAARGVAAARATALSGGKVQGSFRKAVKEAQDAIDAWLGGADRITEILR